VKDAEEKSQEKKIRAQTQKGSVQADDLRVQTAQMCLSLQKWAGSLSQDQRLSKDL
jgi:hypothetical protein